MVCREGSTEKISLETSTRTGKKFLIYRFEIRNKLLFFFKINNIILLLSFIDSLSVLITNATLYNPNIQNAPSQNDTRIK